MKTRQQETGRWRAVMIGFIGLAAVATLSACNGEEASVSNAPGRVLLIGIDGATPRIVEKLIAEGRMPHLASIAESGAHGNLRAHKPISSPRIWNSIVTGMLPRKHGILDFARKDQTGTNRLFTSKDRRSQAIWSIASGAGLSVGVVNFWSTYPLEKVNGVMVSDHLLAKEIDGRERMTNAAKSQGATVIYPPEWNERLSRLVLEDTTPIVAFDDPFADANTLPRWVKRLELQRRFAEDGALARISQEISKQNRPDLLMLLMPGIDRIQHYIWGVMESPDDYPEGLRPTPEGRAGGRKALFAYYEYSDRLIGKLMEDYGPNDLVMVISDHGFEAGQALLRLSGVHDSEKAINGIIFARGPGIAPGTKITGMSVNDVTPTILTWLRLPSARNMDGRTAAFLDAEALPPVPRYPVAELEFVADVEAHSDVEADIVEQLKTLGYIDEE